MNDIATENLPIMQAIKKPETKAKVKYVLEDEDVDKFSQKFKKEIRNINDALDHIENAYQKNKNSLEVVLGMNEKTVVTNFGSEIRELEQYLTASTRFLPDYIVKSCQHLLAELTNRYNEIRRSLMPKKRFEFNSRKNREIKPSKLDPLDGKDLTDHAEICKEKILKEKRIITHKSSDLSLEIKGLSEQSVCELANRINKHDITISDLKNCFVELRGHPGALRVKNLVNCVILCGPTNFSIYAENCHKTLFSIACHQFRLHSSTSCTIFLHVTSRAIIEECHDIKFGPYNYNYDGLEQDFKDSGLDKSVNNYADVADFDWLSPDAPSPNWQLTDKKPNWDEIRQRLKEVAQASPNP